MSDPLKSLYCAKALMALYGDNYVGPNEHFSHGEKILIAEFTGDVDVKVYAKFTPSEFYTIEYAGKEITTGSGYEICEWTYATARFIADGMVNVREKEKE